MFNKWIIPIIGTLGAALIAALGTYLYTLKVEERKPYFEERKTGYSQFFAGTIKSWQSKSARGRADKANTQGDQKTAHSLNAKAMDLEEKSEELFNNGRFRIAVFSDAPVVNATANYLLNHQIKERCNDRSKFLADVAIYQAMRSEMNAPGKVSNEDLIAVLFSCRLEE
jgi:hypothetical protein